jgi:hypothetical protein
MNTREKELEYYVDENECWIVTSHVINNRGYHEIKRDGKRVLTHRYMYIEKYGEIDSSIVLRHTCDNPRCCNPEHLIAGTHADNVSDRVERDRSAKGESNGRAKLTEDDVKYIRNTDETTYYLAQKFNVDRKAIRNIRQYKTWKHVI